MNALILLVATAGACVGWMWADDKPQAGAGLFSLLLLVMFAQRKGTERVGSAAAAVCTFGVLWQASALACVLWYPRLSSKDIGACDEGTGLPVGLLYCSGLLVVAAEFLRWVKARRT